MKVSFYTLGCKVNQYETELLREQFAAAGYDTADTEGPADIYIINTCTVTNLSDRKSRQRIRRVKKENEDAVIVVTGCYAQTDAEAVARIPGVSVVAGTNEKARLVEFVEDYLRRQEGGVHVLPYEELNEYEELGSLTSMNERTRAYIKIQEGCDRFCSYCIIPFARGKVRSRELSAIVGEAEGLVRNGFREIVLTGINTALYGVDFDDTSLLVEGETGNSVRNCSESRDKAEMAELKENKEEIFGGEKYQMGNDGDANGTAKKRAISGIERVVAAVSGIDGDFRIRLSSLEPNVIDAETAQRLMTYPKLCHHMHLSVQSGSDTVLKRMNRRYDTADYRKIVDVFRDKDPHFGVTTDIIVGFPAETEAEFEKSLEIVRQVRFSKVHAFRYSKRNGTKAAQMEEQISGVVKARRMERMLRLAEETAQSFFEECIGDVRRVLFERYLPETSVVEGFTDNYIHTYCLVSHREAELLTGQFADVRLDGLMGEGMKGTIL